MTPQARVQAAIEILDEVIASVRDNGAAADTIIARYFKTRRYAGSKDRRAVREHVYQTIRSSGEVPPDGRSAMIGLATNDAVLAELFDGSPYAPPSIGNGETGWHGAALKPWLKDALPEWFDEAELASLVDRAPLDLRVNTLKSDRAKVAGEMPDAVVIDGLANGLRLPAGSRVKDSPAYRDGRVEIQDAGSQMIALACQVQPGETVVDLCAGAGGKTLALATEMGGQGRLIACDAIRSRMAPLQGRALRAGAAGESRLLDMWREWEGLSDLEGQADCVLVDAPCSGTGTWRRNPEGRWRVSRDQVTKLVAEQARLLDLAAKLVKPDGRLVYAVCSLLAAEGPQQIEEFLQRNQSWRGVGTGDFGRPSGQGRIVTPAHDGCDGFFFAALRHDGASD